MPTNAPYSIRAVSLNPRHTLGKHPQPSIRLIAGEGVDGDAHRGRTVQHLYDRRRDPTQPNRSQVHLFAEEMLTELAAKGFPLAPGALGENILTTGLDLLALPEGACLHLGPEAVVELTGLRTPCIQLERLRPGLQQHLWGPNRTRRAGVMATVRTGGTVRPGDALRLQLPPEPLRPLRPV